MLGKFPGAVLFIPYAYIRDLIRLFVAVGYALITPIGSSFSEAVFQFVIQLCEGGRCKAGPYIQHHLRSHQASQFKTLIETHQHFIRLAANVIDPGNSLFPGAYPILPIVKTHIASAGKTDDPHIIPVNFINIILPET